MRYPASEKLEIIRLNPRQRSRNGYLERHLPVSLALRVDAKRGHAAAAQRVRDDKIQCVEARRLEPFGWSGNEMAQMLHDAFRR